MNRAHFFSQYHPRYPRSLVYMLQASEYDLLSFLSWYRRTSHFAHIERRKRLRMTLKAAMLFVLGWLAYALCVSVSAVALFAGLSLVNILIASAAVLFAPYVTLAALLAAVLVGDIIQHPVEWFLLRRAREKLARHRGVKIAIAGSFGKTTMRAIIATTLSSGKKVGAPGESHNTPLGIARFIETLKGDEDVLVFEFGEYYPGDVAKLAVLVNPHIGIITGVNEAHLERFGSVERAANTIFELADYLSEGKVYVNAESKVAESKTAKERDGRPYRVLYSREGAGRWKVDGAKTDLDGTSFVLMHDDVQLTVRSKLLGLHHVGALAVAAEIAAEMGLAPKEIEAGLNETRPFPHRLEPRGDVHGVVTLDDSYNGNPDGVKAVIEFLASLEGHRRFYVTPGLVEMGERTEAVHEEIGRQLAAAGIEKVVLIRNSVTPLIESGLKKAGYCGDIIWYDDALAAFAALPHMTVKGDVVLLQNDWPDQYA